MISRHLLRIKTFQSIYSYRKNGQENIVNLHKELQYSINKSYELYLYSLQVLVELQDYAQLRIEQIQSRVIKDEQGWKKIERLALNKALTQLNENNELRTKVRNAKITWANEKNFIKDIFEYILDSDIYNNHCAAENSYANDKKFAKKILQNVLLKAESFFIFMEENSVFWNDDVDQVISMAVKTVHKFEESNLEGGSLEPLFRDADAKEFVEDLFKYTLDKWDDYNVYIEERLKNWEQDRVAEIDLILLQMAVTEAIHCKEIPVRVTMNEYIELSKLYSTDKSNIFINGILHSIFEQLQEEKVIVKSGRGLMS